MGEYADYEIDRWIGDWRPARAPRIVTHTCPCCHQGNLVYDSKGRRYDFNSGLPHTCPVPTKRPTLDGMIDDRKNYPSAS